MSLSSTELCCLDVDNEGQVVGLGLGFGLVLGLQISRPRTISRTSQNVKVLKRLKSATELLCAKTVSGTVVRHLLAYLSVHK